MKSTRLVKIAVALLMTYSFAMQPSTAQALDLIKNGQPAATIVLPAQTAYEALTKDATPAQLTYYKGIGDEEVKAAEELQSILEKVSGAKLPIQRGGELPKDTVILVGTELARGAGLGAELDKLDKDGLICRVKGNSLILSGRRARGTLYAAYEFLDSIGCRWTMPGPFGEMYPTLPTIQTKINTTQNPSHTQRYFWCTFGNAPEYGLWTLRNKGNFLRAIGDPVISQSHALAQPLRWALTQDKYRVKTTSADGKETWTLPDDYYSRVNGKPSAQNPNFSNPKVWDLYADYYINFFTNNPGQEYVSISAEDGLIIDEHPESQALLTDDYDWMMGARSATDMLWYFHNQVIDRVSKVFPDKKYGVLVYANNVMPPRKSHVNKHMALVFAPLSVCPLHNIRDPKCKTNRDYVKWFDEWMRQAKAVGAETYYYDYEPTGFCWNMAMICPRWGIIGKNYPYFKSKGLDGHTTQGHEDWAACGLDNYLMQRLYWNVNTNYKDIIADYAKTRFGAAAPAMIEYYDLYEKRMDAIPDLYQNEVWANHLVLTPEVRKQARAILDRAVQLADTPRAKAQMQTMVDLQRSTDVMCDAVEEADATADFASAAHHMEEVFAIKDKLNAIYPKFMNPNRVDPKSRAEYMTGGIYNQYLDFDKKIKAASASLVLPRIWKGSLDTKGTAVEAGMYKPEVSADKLDDLDTTVLPDVKYGTEREPVTFFYRTQTDVPAAFQGKKVSLYFTSLIAREVQIWINGVPVEFTQNDQKSTTWQGPEYFWFNYNHQVEYDVTPYIKAGQKNTIALRVFKKHDVGGSYRRILLLAN